MLIFRTLKIAVKSMAVLIGVILVLLLGPAYAVLSGQADLVSSWYERSRESTGQAPDPEQHPEAVIQIYAARAFKWRGAFAVHTWIAVKPKSSPAYFVLDVNAWRHYHGKDSLRMYRSDPDRKWFGSMPDLLLDIRGKKAEILIEKIIASAENYPYRKTYTAWPGPNSNTFTAHIGRAVPELQLELPSTAIGKDYIGSRLFSRTPTGSGFQLSLGGYLGILISRFEGIEINFLGLSFGIDPEQLAVRLPGMGTVGFRNKA